MKLHKLIMINIMILAIIIAMSSITNFFLWISMEINTMSFIPIMYKKNKYSSNSMMMYFIIQSLTSSIFLLVVLFYNMNMEMLYMNFIVTSVMCMKIAAAPFHMWLPEISEGLTLYTLGILLTLQKIIPLYVISKFLSNVLMLFIIMSAMMGSLGSFGQHSVRKLLVFSSITHLSWMMTLISLNSFMWMMYLIIYSIILMMLLKVMKMTNLTSFSHSMSFNANMIIMFMLSLISMGGMPPTMGFMMKLMALKEIMLLWPLMSIILILSSIINLYVYIRLMYVHILMNMELNKWYTSYNMMLLLYSLLQATMTPIMITLY
uniref:NADH-ubiquinone oxidoreductase chain 2 n=1 Tax=Chiropterargas boueti TaxID=1827022 RepID=A0A1P8AG19_9ACAR|nr:NADH dehydrogenase subunit 2 [Chiropterargas boueti]AMX74066.1 NADH dehydrogenase subunit 2 [Chiropterargas boueti]AMX74079.1 NADH dehydrogenase subunit 2 [Chiropterargas boueti]